MTGGGRSITFGVNISVKELGLIKKLATELREFSTGAIEAAKGLAAINKVGGQINPANIDKAAQAFDKLNQAFQRIKTTSSTAGLGSVAKEVSQATGQMDGFTRKTSTLRSQLAEVNKEASKISTSIKSDEALRATKTQIDNTRSATNKLLSNFQKILSTRQKLSQSERDGVTVTQSVVTQANRAVESFRQLHRTTQFNIQAFSAASKNVEKLGVDADTVKNRYKKVSDVVKQLVGEIQKLAATSQQRINLEKQANAVIKSSGRIAASKQLQQAQQNLNKEKIKGIELTSQLAQIERERARAAQQRREIVATPRGAFGAGAAGADAQSKSIEAATKALDAYDNRLKASKALIEQHNQVQRTAAQVTLRTAAVRNAAAMEVRAAQNMIAQGFSQVSQKELQRAQQSRLFAQQELENAKKVLAARQQTFQQSAAASKVYDKTQKDQIRTSQALINQQQRQSGFLNKINEGFTRVIRTQLLYFASTILIFGAIAKLNASFESLVELSGRTARAFAVSRSSVLLFEERFVALQEAVETTAAVTGESINDVSEAIFQFGSAGLQAEESIAALESTMNLIQATGADVTTTTKTIAATYRLMRGQLEDVGDQTAKFARINDIIAATYRDNQVEINDFTQAMKFALPVSRQLNLNLEQTSGIIALLHNNFIRGGESGRALRVIFSRMSREMDQFSEAFGIAIDPDKPLDFLDVMEQISNRMNTGAITANQVATVFERLGLRGANAFIIMAQQFEELNGVIGKLEDTSAGAAKSMALIKRESDPGQLKVFTENMLILGRTAIEPIGFIILKVVRAINTFAEAIRDTGVEKVLGILLRLVSVLITIKVAAALASLIFGQLGISTGFMATSSIAAALAQGKLIFAMESSLIVAKKNIATMLSLSGALNVLKLAAIKTGAVLIAAFPYVAIVALIGVLVYWIYRQITAQERLIEINNERLEQIREEKKERNEQLASYDNTIAKLEDLNRAYEENRTTILETRKAISEAVKSHGELGIAAAVAGDDLGLFINKTKEQRAQIQSLLDELKKEDKEIFKQNIEIFTQNIDNAAAAYANLQDQLDRGVIQKASPRGLIQEFKITEGEIENQREKLAQYQKNARDAALEMIKLANSNGELARSFGVVINEAFSVAASMNASAENAKSFGNVLEYLERTAINLSELPLREKIDELRKTVEGLEGLRLKFLFKYDFIIPQESINEAKKKTQDAINKIKLLTKSDREIKITLLYEEEDFSINMEHVKKNADQLAEITNSAMRDATKGLDLAQYITVDDQQIVNLFEAVAENTKLIKSGFQEGSKEAVKFANNAKKIDDVRRSILSQAQFYAKNRNEIEIIERTINTLLEDRVALAEYLVVLQQRQIAVTSAYNLQLNAEIDLLQKTRNLSLNTTKNTQDRVDATREQVVATGILYRGAVANEKIARNNLKTIEDTKKGILGTIRHYLTLKEASSEVENATKERGEIYENHRKSLEGHTKSLLAQVNWTHQMKSEIEKSFDAHRKINLYGEDRVSQLRAELVHQRNIIKEEKRYLKDLISEGIILEDKEILKAKDRELRAKTAELQRKETQEIFKQNIGLLKNAQALELALASGSEMLKVSQNIALIDARLVNEMELYNKLVKRIKKEENSVYRLDRQRLVVMGRIRAEAEKRVKQVIKAFEKEVDIRNQFIEQVNTIREMNIALEESKDIKEQILISTMEEQIASKELETIQNRINVIEKERELQGFSEITRRLELNNLYNQQADIIKNRIVKEQQKLNSIREKERNLIDSVNNLYGKQLDNIGQVRDALEEAFKPLVEFDFDQRPFTAAIFASQALGKNLLEIAQLSPQQVIDELNTGLREGTVDFKIFSGHARELAEHIARIGAEERELRQIQEDIRAQEFATDLLRVKRALSVEDIEAAKKAFDKLGESAQVLDPITGKVDYDATRKNMNMLKDLANEIATAYEEAGNTTEQNLKNLQTRLNEILGDIAEVTTKIADELKNTKFADAFFDQMTSIIRQLRDLNGTTIEFKIDDVTAQLARMNVLVPQPTGYQEGGPIGGTGRGDIVPALLEPGEFIIPRNVVESLGVGFFENFRNPKFVKKIAALNGVNEIPKFKDGGLVGYQNGGAVEFTSAEVSNAFNAIEFSAKEVSDALNTVEFSAKEVNEALYGIQFSAKEVADALNSIEFTEEEIINAMDLEKAIAALPMGDVDIDLEKAIAALPMGDVDIIEKERAELISKLREMNAAGVDTAEEINLSVRLLRGWVERLEAEPIEMTKAVEEGFTNVAMSTDLASIVEEGFANIVIDEPNNDRQQLLATLAELSPSQAKTAEELNISNNLLEAAIKGLEKIAEKERIIAEAGLGKEADIGPERTEQLLDLPIEELKTAMKEYVEFRKSILEKEKLLAEAGFKEFGPGKKEELIDLPIDELETLLKEYKKIPLYVEEGVEIGIGAQQDIKINFIYEEELEKLRLELMSLDQTRIELSFNATGLDQIKIDVRGIAEEVPGSKRAGFQTGGPVPGIGSGDIVPALLEPGEFVIRKDIVDKLGISFFKDLNRFKAGGVVGMQAGSPGSPITTGNVRGSFELPAMEPFVEQVKVVREEFDKIAEDTKEIAKNVDNAEFEKITKELENIKSLNVGFVEKLREAAKLSGKKIDVSKWGELTQYAKELGIDPIIITQMGQLGTETDSTGQIINKLQQESGGYFSQIKEIIKGVGSGAIPVGRAITGVRAVIGKFQSEVSNANKEVVEFTEALLNAFGPKIRKAIQSIVKTFQDVFGRILPGLFGGFLDSFIDTQVGIVAAANEAAEQTADAYYDARADLVESLKRNEISYFDYFNSLEDLNKDTADNMADAAIQAEQDRVEAVGDAIVGLTSTILDEVGKWVDGFSDFFGNIIDGFVDIGVGVADSLDEVGALIGNIIEMGIGALGAAGGGGIAAAIGGVAGTALAPGVGTAIGAGAGVAIGSIVGGAVGSIFKTAIPIVGDILKAFEQMASAAIKGVLDIIPYIVELGAMTEDEFNALVGYTNKANEHIKGVLELLPGDIETFTNQFAERLPIIVKKFEELLPDIITALVGGVNSAEKMLEGAIPTVFRIITDQLDNIIALAIPQMLRFFNSILDSLPSLFTSIFTSIINSAKNLFSGNKLTVLFQNIVDTITEVFTSFAKDFVRPLADSLKENMPSLILVMTETLVEAIPILTDAMVIVINAMADVIGDPAIQDALKRAMFALFGAMFEAIRELVPGFDAFLAILAAVVLVVGTLVGAIAVGLLGTLSLLLLVLSPLIVTLGLANAIIIVLAGLIVTVLLPPLTALIGFFGILASVIIGITLKPLIDLFGFFGDVIDAVGKKLKDNEKVQEAILKLQEAFDKLGEAAGKLFEALGPDKADPDLIDAVANAIVFFIEILLLLVVPLEISITIMTQMIDVMTNVIDSLGKLFHIFKLIDQILVGESVVPSLNLLYDILALVDRAINETVTYLRSLVAVFSALFNPVQQIEDITNTVAIYFNTLSAAMLNAIDPVQQLADLIDGTFTTAMDNFKTIINGIIALIPEPGEVLEEIDNTTGSNLSTAEQQLSEGDLVGAFGSATGLYHQGGIFTVPSDPQSQTFYSSLGLASNEGLALLMDKEGILTERGVEAIGGASVLAQLNQGQNPFTQEAAVQASVASAYDTEEEAVSFNVGTIDAGTEPIGSVGKASSSDSVSQETNIEVNIDMSNSNYQSETVAQDVEEQIVGSMQNQEGAMFEEIDTKFGNDTMSGVKRR
ncbi:MAG: phage tail tape measure protein [Candidatus Thorarchaeota archaeon]